jgi:HSP20 family protein
MAKRKEDPFVGLWTIKDLDRLFERLYSHRPLTANMFRRAWVPSMDVYETAKDIVVRMDVAGVDRKSLRITVDDNVLAISGRRVETIDKDNEYYHQVEIEYGEFRRVLDLPRPVDADRAAARYDDGLLYVVLPKTEVEVTIHTIIEIL